MWLGLIAAVVLGVTGREALRSATNADGAFWQGSYTLPLAVGMPILAAFALAATERGRELVGSRFVLVVGLVVSFAQLLAFAQNLRRYTVGIKGPIAYFQHAQWNPPLPSLVLTVAYALAVTAYVAWLLARRTRPGASAAPL
jgi:Mn2+/Fe2+ NRAMP family transporter